LTPFHFGDSRSPLLGILDEPAKDTGLAHGVLLCPPVGQEHVRSHWALRQVASALARAGFHCLRFDWFGVGDSSGRLCEATIERWRQDVADAAQELRDAAGVRKVSIVGLRLGATLAALEAKAVRPQSILLWDPVADGSEYVRELRTIQRELLSDTLRFSQPPASARAGVESSHELVGFEYGAALIQSIERLKLDEALDLPRSRLCLLPSSALGQEQHLRERLSAHQPSFEVRHTRVRAKWHNADDIEELLLPADAIREVSDFLGQRT
jgi:pimeloyl-ACP methyl ester carboxylesterase